MALRDPVQEQVISKFIQRLLSGVSRSAVLKAFPTRTVKRIDLARFRIAHSEAPEKLVQALVHPEGRYRLVFQDYRRANSRISIHVYKLFGSKDRCFTDDSLIFTLDEERSRVMEFCRQAAVNFFSPFLQAHPFGFGDVGSLCVFHHTVPNSSLPILWFDEDQKHWQPLFPARGVYAAGGGYKSSQKSGAWGQDRQS